MQEIPYNFFKVWLMRVNKPYGLMRVSARPQAFDPYIRMWVSKVPFATRHDARIASLLRSSRNPMTLRTLKICIRKSFRTPCHAGQ